MAAGEHDDRRKFFRNLQGRLFGFGQPLHRISRLNMRVNQNDVKVPLEAGGALLRHTLPGRVPFLDG